MRDGYTTGSCATAAALVAALQLRGDKIPEVCPLKLPDGSFLNLPVHDYGQESESAWAMVRKDAGDDPDITHGALVRARVWYGDAPGVEFRAGSGVGVVTRRGLQIQVGEPAINPVPRQMISDHLLALAPSWVVELSIERGEELAQQTFNPRLGIRGGLSILGTTGRVRPFSHASQLCAIRCEVGVALAVQKDYLALVPGHLGERALRRRLPFLESVSVVEVGNDWGFAIDLCRTQGVTKILVAGHPGKLAKVIDHHWDTHSSRSPAALGTVQRCWSEWTSCSSTIKEPFVTVEGFIQSLPSMARKDFCFALANRVAERIRERFQGLVKVFLTDMVEGIYGESECR